MKKILSLLLTITSLLSLTAHPCNMSLTPVYNQAKCFQSSDYSATVVVNNGTTPYTYAWSNTTTDSSTTYSFTASSFTVTVTDANSCTATTSGTFTGVKDAQLHNTNIMDLFRCDTPAHANLFVYAAGGTGRLTYSLDGADTDTIGTYTGLVSGIYTVLITDSLGCTEVVSVAVPQSIAGDQFSYTTNAASCATGTDGQIIITPLQPQDGPWVYAIDGSGNLQFSDTFTNISPGTHTIVVKDYVFGCQFYDTLQVGAQAQACGCSAHFTLYADSTTPHHWFALNQATGTGPITYSWSWGDNSSADSGAMPSHIYSDSGYYHICLTINDSAGCTSTYCDASTYLRSIESPMITVNVILALPDATGIAPLDKASALVSIYPNPAQTQLIISAANFEPQWLTIYNTKGQQLMSEKFIQRLDINALAAGIYFVEIKNDNTVARTRFIKL